MRIPAKLQLGDSGTNRSAGKSWDGRDRKGSAVVEFAIVFPLFLLLIVGAIDFGRAISVQYKLTEAARSGCRVYTVKNELTRQDAEEAVEAVMSTADLSEYKVEFDPPASAAIKHLEPVTVTVSIPYDRVSWLRSSGFLPGYTLTATCIMPGDNSEDPGGAPPQLPPPADDGSSGERDRGKWWSWGWRK